MIRQKIRKARTAGNLVARSVDSGLHTKQSEVDLLEMLRITEEVITSRLQAGIYTERQKDKKRKYTALYNSIKADVLEAVRRVFMNETERATGLVLQKFNTLVLDALFDVLVDVGPEKAIRATTIIVRQIREDILNLGDPDEIDAIIASKVLAEMSKERARKVRRPLTKAQRLAVIARAAERINEIVED